MEIKITKEIKKDNNIYLTFYVDGKATNIFWIREDVEKGELNSIINLCGEEVKAILKKGTKADKEWMKKS